MYYKKQLVAHIIKTKEYNEKSYSRDYKCGYYDKTNCMIKRCYLISYQKCM